MADQTDFLLTLGVMALTAVALVAVACFYAQSRATRKIRQLKLLAERAPKTTSVDDHGRVIQEATVRLASGHTLRLKRFLPEAGNEEPAAKVVWLVDSKDTHLFY